jgi:hypothetical protein
MLWLLVRRKVPPLSEVEGYAQWVRWLWHGVLMINRLPPLCRHRPCSDAAAYVSGAVLSVDGAYLSGLVLKGVVQQQQDKEQN